MKSAVFALSLGLLSLGAAFVPSLDTLLKRNTTDGNLKVVHDGYTRIKLPDDAYVSSCCNDIDVSRVTVFSRPFCQRVSYVNNFNYANKQFQFCNRCYIVSYHMCIYVCNTSHSSSLWQLRYAGMLYCAG
jgi:hypothetical protein